jgi:hypothetical protein
MIEVLADADEEAEAVGRWVADRMPTVSSRMRSGTLFAP